ncbi:MAG: sugar transferase [Bryobacterales bacterium]|nr:sugar transferase [Bryobacterales bacterium]
MLKRTMDIAVAAVALLILCPLFALLAIIVKLDSPGGVLYRANRMGLGGRRFRMLKFRSMVEHADEMGPGVSVEHDPRITRAGAVLRRTKLDELPQLINVLVGDMSLVGPRPEAPEFVQQYSAEDMVVLSVRPGITDWASIRGVDEGRALACLENPQAEYQSSFLAAKLELQRDYVRNRSFRMDLSILLCTAVTLLRRSWTPPSSRSHAGRPDLTRSTH